MPTYPDQPMATSSLQDLEFGARHDHYASSSENSITANWPHQDEPFPLLLSVNQACVALKCCRTTAFKLLAQGKLERRKYNRSTRVTLRSVLELAGLSENDLL